MTTIKQPTTTTNSKGKTVRLTPDQIEHINLIHNAIKAHSRINDRVVTLSKLGYNIGVRPMGSGGVGQIKKVGKEIRVQISAAWSRYNYAHCVILYNHRINTKRRTRVTLKLIEQVHKGTSNTKDTDAYNAIIKYLPEACSAIGVEVRKTDHYFSKSDWKKVYRLVKDLIKKQ